LVYISGLWKGLFRNGIAGKKQKANIQFVELNIGLQRV
jgi:hypothetical protein